MSGELIVLVVVVAVVLLVVGLTTAYLTAHRLDRLHIRTDLARTALFGILQRRHTVAAAIARAINDESPDDSQNLTDALHLIRSHPPEAIAGIDPTPAPGDRSRDQRPPVPIRPNSEAEFAENRLGAALANIDPSTLPADLAAELEDVSDRVAMARRFYNDAVRDTRTLREQSIVRVLKLAGRAPMPDYVELADTPPPGA